MCSGHAGLKTTNSALLQRCACVFLHSKRVGSIATPFGSTNERCTTRILACERLCFSKGMPAGFAHIAWRAFLFLDYDKISQITSKAMSQNPADIKNEKSASELLSYEFSRGRISPCRLGRFFCLANSITTASRRAPPSDRSWRPVPIPCFWSSPACVPEKLGGVPEKYLRFCFCSRKSG